MDHINSHRYVNEYNLRFAYAPPSKEHASSCFYIHGEPDTAYGLPVVGTLRRVQSTIKIWIFYTYKIYITAYAWAIVILVY